MRFLDAEDLELLLQNNGRMVLSSDLLLADDARALLGGDLATERIEVEQSAATSGCIVAMLGCCGLAGGASKS
jgi:hypothetical protein